MKQVLLIDASPLFREFLREKLVAEQVSVETATGNRDAYTKLITILPDLIIIDVERDLDDLQEFLAKKHSDPNAHRIPIIISGPVIPRNQVATLAQFAVVKYFTKPIKFDVFFASIGKILKANFTMDQTPCVLEMHVNGSIIFIEVAQGLNREKLSLLKYKLTELIDRNTLREPKVVVMMTNMELSFVDGANLEMLFDNITADERVKLKNIKVLSLDPFTKELISGHPQYKGIEIAGELNDVLNSLIDSTTAPDVNELVSRRILTADSTSVQDGSVEMSFGHDKGSAERADKDAGNILKVAVVDDDIVVRKLLQNGFAAISAETVLFENGVSFMQAVNTQEFDLIILDLYIPDMNGFDILRSLQQRQYKAPILIYSQATMRDSVIQALSLGARSYLVKPQKTNVVVQKAVEVLHAQG